MPGRAASKKRAVEASVVEFLSEFARYLVAAGITSRRFSSIARVAFFRAASTEARFRNKRLNQSTVAAMTGLTRVQVRGFARQANPVPPKTRDRLDALIEGWITDPAFCDPGKNPKSLRATGAGRTFRSLVRRYGGDVPPRAFLRELQRNGFVELSNGVVSLKQSASHTRDEHRLVRASRMLEGLISAPSGGKGPKSHLRTFNLEIAFPATSDKGRLVLQRRLSESLGALMRSVHAIGSSAAVDSPPFARQHKRVTRTRLAFVMEDFEPDSAKDRLSGSRR
jgi:hypothetical protein